MGKPLQYTPLGKWYGIISLICIGLFANPISAVQGITPSTLFLVFQGIGDRTLMGSLVLFLLITMGYLLIALSLFLEQKWARWFALAAYSLNIANILTPLKALSTILLTPLGSFLIPGILLKLSIPLFGIFLVLRKPKSAESA